MYTHVGLSAGKNTKKLTQQQAENRKSFRLQWVDGWDEQYIESSAVCCSG